MSITPLVSRSYDRKTRFDMFEEALEVTKRLLESDTPVTLEGKYFPLHDAILLPRPQRSRRPDAC